MNSAAVERERLVALLAALEEPARAATLPPGDPILIAVARHHRLTPLLSMTCGVTLPPPLAELFRRDRVITGARNMMLGRVAEECIRAFAAARIPTIVLKGLDYETRLYAAVAARPTADVDLLVPDEQRRPAFEVLDRLGFEPRAAAPGFDDVDYHEVAWTRAGVEIDLHLALAPLARCAIDYAAVWREARPARLGETEVLVLELRQAAIFHALHMAIDHFDVPALYLLDLARLLPSADDTGAAEALARQWRCWRPLASSLALAAEFLPIWSAKQTLGPRPSFSRGILETYGGGGALPRLEQLRRKLIHFDDPRYALRYAKIQLRRNAVELAERHLRRRSARERLGL